MLRNYHGVHGVTRRKIRFSYQKPHQAHKVTKSKRGTLDLRSRLRFKKSVSLSAIPFLNPTHSPRTKIPSSFSHPRERSNPLFLPSSWLCGQKKAVGGYLKAPTASYYEVIGVLLFCCCPILPYKKYNTIFSYSKIT